MKKNWTLVIEDSLGFQWDHALDFHPRSSLGVSSFSWLVHFLFPPSLLEFNISDMFCILFAHSSFRVVRTRGGSSTFKVIAPAPERLLLLFFSAKPPFLGPEVLVWSHLFITEQVPLKLNASLKWHCNFGYFSQKTDFTHLSRNVPSLSFWHRAERSRIEANNLTSQGLGTCLCGLLWKTDEHMELQFILHFLNVKTEEKKKKKKAWVEGELATTHIRKLVLRV